MAEAKVTVVGKYVDKITPGVRKTEAVMKRNAKSMARSMRSAASRARAAWSKSLKGIASAGKRAGKALALMGVAAVAGLAAFIKKSADAADAIQKMSLRTGAAVEFLSKLDQAAKLGGSSLGAMESAMRRMSKSANDANVGLSTAVRSYEALGVSVNDTSGQLKSTEVLFEEVAQALNKIENETQKAALAQEIFGRSGTALFPVFDALKQASDDIEKFGGVTKESADNAAAFNDALTRVSAAISGVGFGINEDVLPGLTEMIEQFANWIGENKPAFINAISFSIAAVSIAVERTAAAYRSAVKGTTAFFEFTINAWRKIKEIAGDAIDFVIDKWTEAVDSLSKKLEPLFLLWDKAGGFMRKAFDPFARSSPSAIDLLDKGLSEAENRINEFQGNVSPFPSDAFGPVENTMNAFAGAGVSALMPGTAESEDVLKNIESMEIATRLMADLLTSQIGPDIESIRVGNVAMTESLLGQIGPDIESIRVGNVAMTEAMLGDMVPDLESIEIATRAMAERAFDLGPTTALGGALPALQPAISPIQLQREREAREILISRPGQGGGETRQIFNISISGIDGPSIEKFVRTELVPRLKDAADRGEFRPSLGPQITPF